MIRFSAALACALVACLPGPAQDALDKARDAARSELARFREQAEGQVAERQKRIAALRKELLETSGRASEGEVDAVTVSVRYEDAGRARDAIRDDLAETEASVAEVVVALSERGAEATSESRPADARLEAMLRDLEQRWHDAGVIRKDGRLVRIGDLQWLEVLPGDRAVVGRAGRSSPVGPIEVPGIAALADALAKGTPPPFVPVDPTGRLDARPPAQQRDLQGWFRAGGPVVIVIVLLGGIGLLLGVGRLVAILLEPAPVPADVARARDAVVAGDRETAARILRARRGSVHAALADAVLADVPAGGTSKEARVEQILLRTVDRFERFLPLLAVLAAVSPLLGLLGTVVGMIRMFDALAGGTTAANHVEALSGGIGEALITTEAGLLFAIPLILLHALISARADRLEAALEDAALEVAGGPEPA